MLPLSCQPIISVEMAARKPDVDAEDYWSASSASTIKARGINLFDDSLDFEDAKKLLKNQHWEDDEESDIINWDGSSAVSSGTRVEFSKSARYRPQTTGQTVSGTPPRDGIRQHASHSHVETRTPETERRFVDREPSPVRAQPPANHSAPVAQKARKPAFSPTANLSIDDVVKSTPRTTQPTVTEVAKLETEVNFLKRSLHAAKKDRWVQIAPVDTIRRVILGEPYSLEMYKSKEEKLALLDEAIRLHDGNAITMAVLFLRDTVKNSIFNAELVKRLDAVDHYVNYLALHFEVERLMDVLGMLGRTDDAAMMKFKQAISISNPETRLRALQTCNRAHFQSDAMLEHESRLIQEQTSLLEKQMPIDAADEAEERKGELKFKEHPRQASLVNCSVITTLYYCCQYHYDLAENSYASPLSLKKEHRLTEKQFLWTALMARAKLKQWKDVEALFQTKGWLGGTKMKAAVGFDRVVNLLHKVSAPRQILNKYCMLIDDTEKRLEVGQTMGCHECVLETYKQMKDRQQFLQYSSKLKNHSQEWFYAQDIIKNSSIKWKN